jgi:class 3 adenylate cyclase
MLRSTGGSGDVTVERRHAAVLFADLSGFTALVESTSPEDVYALVRPLMDELVLLVRAHGGDIQQVLGDGFMSVFGLGLRDGNEAGRAVEAALALVEAPGGRWGRLPVHVGIECGDVLVSPSWEPARFAVWGRAVTVAKRLCDRAGPSTVHIGPQAYARGGAAVLAGLGVAPATAVLTGLKGIVGEVPAYRVTGGAARPRVLAGCA